MNEEKDKGKIYDDLTDRSGWVQRTKEVRNRLTNGNPRETGSRSLYTLVYKTTLFNQ